MPDITYASALLGFAVTLGNFSIWIGMICAVTCVALYWNAMLRTVRLHPEGSPAAPKDGEKPADAAPAVRKAPSRSRTQNAEEAKTDRIGLLARKFFFATCACAVVGSLALWTVILGQQYTVQYVHENTNRALPFGYRFAAFWSNQEGTFFLWALYNMVLGGVLLKRTKEDERWVMPFFTLVNVSLFALLCFMNPFWIAAASEVRQKLTEVGAQPEHLAFLPKTGWDQVLYYFGWARYVNPQFVTQRGLNESLQNPWFVIHPPTLFVGYASMIIASCFALAALMRRDYDTWINRAAPWLGFAWCILGTGIFLGAYWAYETLGWGGYWSWDPVENSSLIPWLVATTLIHGLLAQRNRGNFKQANLFIGLMAGNAVLLGSFMVRSGVLQDVSVHSFATPQKSVFFTLLGVMAVWFVMSVGIWLWRYKDIQSEIAFEHTWERHFGFFLGVIVLASSALIVSFGVTMPVWSPWLGHKGAVDYTFYNKALLPVVFAMVTLMTLTPLMPWKRAREDAKPLPPLNKVLLGLSGLFTLLFAGSAVYAWLGGFQNRLSFQILGGKILSNDTAYISLGLIIALAIFSNLLCLKRAARGGILNVGAWVSHLGFITVLAGVVYTSRFNTTTSFFKVEKGESVRALGREFVFQGQRPASGPADRDRMQIDIRKDGRTTQIEPKLFISAQSGQAMAWPTILHEGLNDVYVEPTGVDPTGIIALKEVAKNAEQPASATVQHRRSDIPQEVTLAFEGLDTSEMQKTLRSGKKKPFNVYADVALTIDGVEQHLRPALRISETPEGPKSDPIPVRLTGLSQGSQYTLVFQDTNMQPGNLQADFALVPDTPVYQGHFQVLYVPGIQILWWGNYLMILGGIIVFLRRRQLATRTVPVRTPQPTPRTAPVAPRPEPAGAE